MKEWSKFKKPNGTIDLVKAWKDEHPKIFITPTVVMNFLNLIESYMPISSRQAAAIALAQADLIYLSK